MNLKAYSLARVESSCCFSGHSQCLSYLLLSMPFSLLLSISPELWLLRPLMPTVILPPICPCLSSPLPFPSSVGFSGPSSCLPCFLPSVPAPHLLSSLLQLQLLRPLMLYAILPAICPLPYFPHYLLHFLLLS